MTIADERPTTRLRTRTKRLQMQSIAMALLFATVSLPLLAIGTPSTDLDAVSQQPDALRFVPFGLGLLLIVDVIEYNRIVRSMKVVLRSDIILFALIFFVVGVIINALITVQLTAIAYAIVLAILLVNFHAFWLMLPAERRRFYRLASLVLVAFVVGAFALYGAPKHRYVGGIHPNVFASAVVAGAIFGLLAFRRYGIVLWGFFFVAAAVVSSRYAMVALIVLVAVRFICGIKSMSLIQHLLSIVVLFVGLILVVLNSDYIISLMALDDPSRGISSGASGRFELYDLFMPQFERFVFFGAGFRMRTEYMGVHNGYLNTLLENGLFISMVLFLALLGKLFKLFLFSLRSGIRDRQEIAGTLGGLFAVSFSSFFQPQLVNFGDPMGLIFLLLLSANFFVEVSPETRPAVPKDRPLGIAK